MYDKSVTEYYKPIVVNRTGGMMRVEGKPLHKPGVCETKHA